MTRFAATLASHDRSGFTLVELMVALVLSAIILLGARTILEQLADSADRTTKAAASADHRANMNRVIRALFEHASASDSIYPFIGTRTMTQFSSWCDVPGGWSEHCTLTLAIVPTTASDSIPSSLPQAPTLNTSNTSVRVIVWTSAGDTLHFKDSIPAAELRYLDDVSDGGHWMIGWPAGITTPLAVGIVTTHDTTVLRIGERR
jgi:prepilin-type N-terminal cleavage/methylation domain-containing protein